MVYRETFVQRSQHRICVREYPGEEPEIISATHAEQRIGWLKRFDGNSWRGVRHRCQRVHTADKPAVVSR
jgi:hypothetical protein